MQAVSSALNPGPLRRNAACEGEPPVQLCADCFRQVPPAPEEHERRVRPRHGTNNHQDGVLRPPRRGALRKGGACVSLSCSRADTRPPGSQGTHNVAGAIDPSFYKHEKYFDAHLTALGWAQAQALRQHVTTHGLAARLEVVVVSPLTRAVETAVAAFGGDSPVPVGAPCLMAARPEVEGVCTAHPGIAAGPLPFVACELCREHLGVHPCDRRRPLSHYKAAFPSVDWSPITQEQVRSQH